MNYQCKSVGRLVILLLLMLLPNIGSSAEESFKQIQLVPKQAIGSEENIELVIGVPHDYRQRGIKLQQPPCKLINRRKICLRYAFGTRYQILDWIETAQIQGAYISRISLHLMHRLAQKNFDAYFRLFTVVKHNRYYPELTASRNGNPLNNPLDAYYKVLSALTTGDAPPEFSLEFDTHLDASLFAMYQVTKKWLLDNPPDTDGGEHLWTKLIDGLNFMGIRDGNAAADKLIFSGKVTASCRDSAQVKCLDEAGTSDYLVLRKQALGQKPTTEIFGKHISPNDDGYGSDSDAWIADPGNKLALQPVRAFFARNYLSYRHGSGSSRYFRFKLGELFHILRDTVDVPDISERSSRDDLALVLTGGGVKAAYQTRLIDYLYNIDGKGSRFLVNHYRPTGNDNSASLGQGEQPLEVKYVIGTSGGALLGMFVSAFTGGVSDPYTELLWKEAETGKYLNSTKIFPVLDLMRWLSFLVTGLIFAISVTVFSHWGRFREKYMLTPIDSSREIDKAFIIDSDRKNRFLNFSIAWIIFLAVTPWIINYVNGDAYEEHIPAVQGIFYFFYMLVAANTDNHIVRLDVKREVDGGFGFAFIAYLLLGMGLVLGSSIYVFATGQSGAQYVLFPEFLPLRITWPSLTCVTGLLMIAWAMRFWYLEKSPWFKKIKGYDNGLQWSVLLPVAAVVITVVVFLICNYLNLTTPLELTPTFWKWHIPISILIVVLMIYLGFNTDAPAWLREFLEPKMRYLMLPHPAKTILLPFNRISRMMLFLTLAWVWWNVIVAPGLYGNEDAKKFLAKAGNQVIDCSLDKQLTLSTFYVAPATSLEKKLERYFLFEPTESGTGLPYEQQLQISSDNRWTQIDNSDFDNCKEYKAFLSEIAFASGSPFPIFPAHKIAISKKVAVDETASEEWLVDGGYAHNIPIEAARQLGAEKVLVISSSPVNPEETGFRMGKLFSPGLMIQNFTRLIPYFYNRSQIEDVLSAEDMMVAYIAPSNSGGDWPLLTDFRSEVIERLVHEADNDIDRRIGYMQNWGRPRKKE